MIKLPMWPIDPGQVWANCQRMGLPMPVGLWEMWEGSGNKVYDLSGNGRHGTLVNTVPWIATADGCGLAFTGGLDGLDAISIPEISFAGQFTIFAKCTFNRTFYPIIFGDSSAGSFLRVNVSAADGPLAIRIGGQAVAAGAINLLDTNEYSIAATRDFNNNVLYYINAVKDDPSGGNSATFVIDTLFNGKYAAVWRGWEGNGYIVCLFDRALNQSQIDTLHADPYGMVRQPDTLALWVAATQGAAAGFQPAWAINSNVILQPGVY